MSQLISIKQRALDFGVRLALETSGRIAIVLDREAPGDHVIEHEGLKVLLVGHEVAQLVAGATLDTEDTPEGTRLVMSKE